MARRSFWTNVTIVTASLTLVGGIMSSALALFGSTGQAQLEFDREVCKMAYEALGDETLNPHLTKVDVDRFVAEQLNLARKCALKVS